MTPRLEAGLPAEEGLGMRSTKQGTRGRTSGVRDTLPRETVTSREEMAVMLARHHRVLRDYARHYLPDAPDAVIETVAGRAVDSMLAIEYPSLTRGKSARTRSRSILC
jgi:hypothetical protein